MSGKPGTSNTDTAASNPRSSLFSENKAPSPGPFSFARPQSATGSSSSENTFAFGRSGSAFGTASAFGTTGTGSFGSSTSTSGSAFGSGGSLFGQPKPATAFGATFSANTNPPPVTKDVPPSVDQFPDPGTNSTKFPFEPTAAMPADRGKSSRGPHTQDNEQNRAPTGAFGQPSSAGHGFAAFAMPTTSSFGRPATAQQPTTGSVFGGGTSAFGTTTNQPATGLFGAFGKQPSATGTGTFSGTSAFERIPTGSAFGQSSPSPTLDPGKLERLEELMRKSLLGEELVNTRFHLFSAKSSTSGRVVKPRVVCGNNALLAKCLKYFLDLLSSDINASDPSLTDLMGDNDIPSSARIDDYGYEDDSDLEDYDDPVPAENVKSTASAKAGTKTQLKDGKKLSADGSESDNSDASVDQTKSDGSFFENEGSVSSAANSEVADTSDDEGLGGQPALRLRSLGSRHILVKDTAFQTWYTLLNYLYTGKFSFLPLSSTTLDRHRKCSASSLDVPRCSAKSMYRLASKVGLDYLRNEAFSYIRSNLTEHNILKELSCSLVSKHPQLLEMELSVLYSYIASPPVVTNFRAFAERIANKEISHGVDIIVGIHSRLLKERQPLSLKLAVPTSLPSSSEPPASVKPVESASKAHEAEAKDAAGPSDADKRGTRSESLPSRGSKSTPRVLLPTSTSEAVPTTSSVKQPDTEGKETSTEKGKQREE